MHKIRFNGVQLIDISRLALLVSCKVVGIKAYRKFIGKEEIHNKFSHDFLCFSIIPYLANGVRIITEFPNCKWIGPASKKQ